MRNPPSWMMNYIHARVAQKASFYEYQASWQVELQKSDQLVAIENKDKTEKLKKIKFDGRIVL